MTVLILTDEGDTTADRVAVELAARGVPVVQVAPSDFPTRVAMSAEIGQSSWSGSLVDVSSGNTLVNLAEVRSVYYRRPNQFRLVDGMSGPEKAFAYGEARRGFGGVTQSLAGVLWVNDLVAAARCEYKPVQLAAAVACGLPVPETTVTNDPESAYAWAAKQAAPIVYKPMSGVWHADEGQMRVLYTSLVTDVESLRDPALSLTAHMLQVQIEKTFEARAVVVGDQVFAVAIHAASELGRTDWRADYASHAYEIVDLPADVRDGLVRLHRRLGLAFGAADLIRDPAGRWVFLETNQCGEWGWLAEETGLPIAGAVADVLGKGAS